MNRYPHFLVVLPNGERHIEHPDDCPLEEVEDGGYSFFVDGCDVGVREREVGLADLPEDLSPGRHEVEFWRSLELRTCAIRLRVLCGPCDLGLTMSCTCTPVLSADSEGN